MLCVPLLPPVAGAAGEELQATTASATARQGAPIELKAMLDSSLPEADRPPDQSERGLSFVQMAVGDVDTATSVMAELVAALRLSGHALVVDDRSGKVAAALGETDARVEKWVRQAGTPTVPQAWVPDGVFDFATLRLSRGREALEMVLYAIASKLKGGGRIFVYGRNDEGVRAAAHVVSKVFGSCDTLETKRHARIVGAVQAVGAEPKKGELEQWRTETILDLPAGPVSAVTYPGLFARGRLDPGTKLLVESLPVLA
jgi:16S rRNA (guanine1207-N2)-methyltransferase